MRRSVLWLLFMAPWVALASQSPDAPPDQHPGDGSSAIERLVGPGKSHVDLETNRVGKWAILTDIGRQDGDAPPAPPDQHPGAPVAQEVQVIDLTAPAHQVILLIAGKPYGVTTIPDGAGGNGPAPQPPAKPDPGGPGPEEPQPPDGDGSAPADALSKAARSYYLGIPAVIRSIADQVKPGDPVDIIWDTIRRTRQKSSVPLSREWEAAFRAASAEQAGPDGKPVRVVKDAEAVKAVLYRTAKAMEGR